MIERIGCAELKVHEFSLLPSFSLLPLRLNPLPCFIKQRGDVVYVVQGEPRVKPHRSVAGKLPVDKETIGAVGKKVEHSRLRLTTEGK